MHESSGNVGGVLTTVGVAKQCVRAIQGVGGMCGGSRAECPSRPCPRRQPLCPLQVHGIERVQTQTRRGGSARTGSARARAPRSLARWATDGSCGLQGPGWRAALQHGGSMGATAPGGKGGKQCAGQSPGCSLAADDAAQNYRHGEESTSESVGKNPGTAFCGARAVGP